MKQFNFNTLLSASILAAIGWTYRSIEMTKLEVTSIVVRFQNNENSLLELKVKVASLETQIVQARIDMAKFESRNVNRRDVEQ